MKEYLENGFSTEKLKLELTDENAEFYFAELDRKVIGYLKINIGQSDSPLSKYHIWYYNTAMNNTQQVGKLMVESGFNINPNKGIFVD